MSETKGNLKKIAEIPIPCQHPEHNPPSCVVLDPGVYEYTCPACRITIVFTVPRITCKS